MVIFELLSPAGVLALSVWPDAAQTPRAEKNSPVLLLSLPLCSLCNQSKAWWDVSAVYPYSEQSPELWKASRSKSPVRPVSCPRCVW